MDEKAAFQIVILNITGGPREDFVTGILARSTSIPWSSNSLVAIDPGTLLAGLTRLLGRDNVGTTNGKSVVTEGPFTNLDLPYETPSANAAHVFREKIGTMLVSHAHLDHMCGMVINLPIIASSRGSKTLAGLSPVLAAIQHFVFNGVIWPNMTDEDWGAGFLKLLRLPESGDLGTGISENYVQVCEGLLTRCFGVSHGCCRQRYHPGSATLPLDQRGPRYVFQSISGSKLIHLNAYTSTSPTSRSPPKLGEPVHTVVESSAFFLRDQRTGNEIIVFGDVEPDSLSLKPRNKRIWEAAAPKIITGALRAIFIECSYNDSVDDSSLYGHLCPRHLIAELSVLAAIVDEIQVANSRQNIGGDSIREDTSLYGKAPEVQSRPNSIDSTELLQNADTEQFINSRRLPLVGMSVFITHIKDHLLDGPPPRDRIMEELRAQGQAARLGCEFCLPTPGESIFI